MSEPFIPDASDRILAAMGAEGAPWPENVADYLDGMEVGQAFTVPDVLFAKIDDETRETLENRFSGS